MTAARILILTLALVAAGRVPAADLPGPPSLPAPAPGAPASSIQAFGDKEPACEEWTDACSTCRRGADGAPACSNVGIACQPRDVICTRKQEPARP